MAKEIDFTDKSFDELDAIHEAVMQAREKKMVEKQNELIRQYQDLRVELIKHGVASDDQLPRFKVRGWTRSKPN